MEHLYDLAVFRDKIINKKIVQLETVLTAFSKITNIPVSFFSATGKYLWSTLPEKRICSANRDFGSDQFDCTRNLLSSMNISLSLPEVYMFLCNSGFINLCQALTMEKKLYGFLMAGPIAMGNNMEKLVDSFSGKIPSMNIDHARIIPLLRDMKLYSPKEIGYLTTLFSASFAAALGNPSAEDSRHQSYQEQSELNQKLIQIKKEHLTVDYPYASENTLIDIIKAGDTELCRKRFGKYVEDIIVFEQGNMSITKLRLVAFFTQLIKSDDAWQKNYENLFLIEKINDAQTIKEIMQAGNSLIFVLTESVALKNYSGGSDIIKQVVKYLHANYSENITLKSAADAVHASSSYLSTLFKQEMGTSFISYLNDIRLAHSEKLLSDTAMPITEICTSTGFSSPSYFAKQFKARYGITPKEFRHSVQ